VKRFRPFILGAALLGLGALPRAATDDVAVVVNRSNPVAGLTLVQVRKYLLAENLTWPSGAKVIVVTTKAGQPDRNTALKAVCGMSETDFTLYFMHASFSGDSGEPPRTFASAALLEQMVATTPGAIGFLPSSEVGGAVKVVAIDGALPGQPAYKIRAK
jgi:hypothetical protein